MPRRSVRRIVKRLLSAIMVVSIVFALAPTTSAVAGSKESPHCITPTGQDLNEAFHTTDAFVAPFCTEVSTGSKWRPILRWLAADSWESTPDGFTPRGDTPLHDFLLKFEGARYVVDAGTPQEREYVFSAQDLILQIVDAAGGPDFVRWMPNLHPLPPGTHTVAKYAILSESTCDGFSEEDGGGCVPEGEHLTESVEFVVRNAGH